MPVRWGKVGALGERRPVQLAEEHLADVPCALERHQARPGHRRHVRRGQLVAPGGDGGIDVRRQHLLEKIIEHAAGSDALIAHLIITGGMQGMPVLGDSAVYKRNKAALREFAGKSMDHASEMILALSDADMTKEVVLFGNTLPRHRALMLLLDHFPWTLGQVVPYLRLNGVTPPAYAPF